MELEGLLERASRDNWCIRWSCTTCGSQTFRRAVLELAGDASTLTQSSAQRLLLSIRETDLSIHPIAVEYLLRWAGNTLKETETAALLGDSQAGYLYAQMLKARDAADARRAEDARRQDPAFVAAERARKAADRANRHQERLAAKRVRDELRSQLLGKTADGLLGR